MAGGLAEDARPVLHSAAFRIGGGEIKPPDPRERDRGGTHRARFQSNVEVAAGQPLVAKQAAGGSDCENFGVCRGVQQLPGAVAVKGEEFSVLDDGRPDGHLSPSRSIARRTERLVHEG